MVKKNRPINKGPSVEEEKECTLSRTPERVKNVPSTVSENVAMASERFQTRNSPRRSLDDDRVDVGGCGQPGQQGRVLHGVPTQKPPQPSTW